MEHMRDKSDRFVIIEVTEGTWRFDPRLKEPLPKGSQIFRHDCFPNGGERHGGWSHEDAFGEPVAGSVLSRCEFIDVQECLYCIPAVGVWERPTT